jgi:hypothetical protein
MGKISFLLLHILAIFPSIEEARENDHAAFIFRSISFLNLFLI